MSLVGLSVECPQSTPTGLLTHRLAGGHRLTVKSLLFHPHNADILISGGVEGIFVWSLSAGRVSQVVTHANASDYSASVAAVVSGTNAHESDVECMCWTHGGATLITGSKDATVKAWSFGSSAAATSGGASALRQAATPQLLSFLETITGHKGPVLSVVYCPETCRLASAGRDAAIKVWDASTLAPDWRTKVRQLACWRSGPASCGCTTRLLRTPPRTLPLHSASTTGASSARFRARARDIAVTSSR